MSAQFITTKKRKINHKSYSSQSQQTDANVRIRSKICNVCNENKQQNRYISLLSVASKTCQTPTHKKCLQLRLFEIRDIKNFKTETHWECKTYMSDNSLTKKLVRFYHYIVVL